MLNMWKLLKCWQRYTIVDTVKWHCIPWLMRQWDVGGGFYKIYIARLNSTIPLCLQASLCNSGCFHEPHENFQLFSFSCFPSPIFCFILKVKSLRLNISTALLNLNPFLPSHICAWDITVHGKVTLKKKPFLAMSYKAVGFLWRKPQVRFFDINMFIFIIRCL